MNSPTILRSLSSSPTLDLSNIAHNPNRLKVLASLANPSSLVVTTLRLRYNFIGPQGGQFLSQLLGKNSLIQYLDLCGNELGDEGAKEISKVLKTNTSLLFLSLSDNEIGDEGASYLSEALSSNTTLQTLDLSDNLIGASGACKLSQILKTNSSLQHLELLRNSIGNEGASFFAEALYHNSSLIELNLEDNLIGDEGAQILYESLQHNTSLLKLELSFNSVNEFSFEECSLSSNSNKNFNSTTPKIIISPSIITATTEELGLILTPVIITTPTGRGNGEVTTTSFHITNNKSIINNINTTIISNTNVQAPCLCISS